jgi:5-formyltetrahydrofolate cyclo-ligase
MSGDAKFDLRRRMRKLAAERGDGEKFSARIVEQLRCWDAWKNARKVCAFWPLPDEPGVLVPWPVDREVVLPRVEGDRMTMFVAGSRDELVPGAFGILEPPGSAVSVDPPAFDVILVPGLAFDRSGGRLGRGRGYYDKFLTGASGLKVGVCFDEQIVETIPREIHDIAMDALVTPSGVILCERKNIG